MSGLQNTLFIEGTFRELSEELADYIDIIKKTQSEATTLRNDLYSLFEKLDQAETDQDSDALGAAKDEILKMIVGSSAALNSAPEKDFMAVYNLLIHLIHQSSNMNRFLQPVCLNLKGEITSSPNNRFGLTLSVLSTIFNTLEPDDLVRYRVLTVILDVVEKTLNFETLKPQLKHLDEWMKQWGVPAEQQRILYSSISRVAEAASDEEQAYEYRIRALRTISSTEASTEEARTLSVEALKSALNNPSHYDFEDLSSLDSIQALRSSDAEFYQLLEIFTADQLEDYSDFKEEHRGWIEENQLNEAVLERKMRLLTLASLAASTGQTRSLPYTRIASDLKIPLDDVEMWVIDVIRAGLVEGKLSQLNQTFLIHRSTYRVFGENQWREVASRLDMWRTSLIGVLGVIRQEKEAFIQQREQEARALEAKASGAGMGYRRMNRDTIDVGME